ncbi:diguanylate cyclase (GGDEF) domain-containing protein [Pseudacidovorax sp. RU35E]|uniref:GGDEF domain-containing protein n=1 Tax=uncultured Pseudacidovorax sp. TaxID=679313 RepID=UPI000955BCFE|nr:GGDEF domain-containing protein [uncultured Pseudacidovorax sp.]SIP99907.1 diguanylate cyclase (GGDEF) domain-containing protein [Pseudacidovorax sp. RU35E]
MLNQLVNAVVAAVLLVTALLAALVFNGSVQRLRAVHEMEDQLQVYRLALSAVEHVSAERGPMNAALGRPGQFAPALDAARRKTDVSLEALRRGAAACNSCQLGPYEFAAIESELQQARMQVQNLLTQAVAQRDPTQMSLAIDRMIGVVDLEFRLIDQLGQSLQRLAPEIAAPVNRARLAARLRESAGRLGSKLTVALATRRDLSSAERQAVAELLGRIRQLSELLQTSIPAGQGTGDEARAFGRVADIYFGQGMAYFDATLERMAQQRGPSPAEFADAYVPSLAPMVALRDLETHLAQSRLAALQDRAWWVLTGVLVATLSLATLLAVGVVMLNRRLLSPLLDTVHRLIGLTQEDTTFTPLAPAQRRRGYARELRTIFAALRHLEELLQRSIHVRRERDALIARLHVLAGTDHLTGLPNRRTFEQRLLQAGAESGGQMLALIMFDIDHFKQINDQHGHEVGDQLLRQFADRLRSTLHRPDQTARIGGEEFVVFQAVARPAEAMALAEHLRSALSRPFSIPDHGTMAVTASFGVALTRQNAKLHTHELLRRADQALYRAKRAGRNRCEMADFDVSAYTSRLEGEAARLQ